MTTAHRQTELLSSKRSPCRVTAFGAGPASSTAESGATPRLHRKPSRTGTGHRDVDCHDLTRVSQIDDLLKQLHEQFAVRPRTTCERHSAARVNRAHIGETRHQPLHSLRQTLLRGRCPGRDDHVSGMRQEAMACGCPSTAGHPPDPASRQHQRSSPGGLHTSRPCLPPGALRPTPFGSPSDGRQPQTDRPRRDQSPG